MWSDFVEVHWSRWGEAYVTPVEPDLVGVAILSRQRPELA
ncbi:truncated oxidoreductase [Mycobacterium tuberculosis HKBS1]|nr:truncated oxidoreductase [Mycobacterium tuberculosis HKBS1]